ncbi:MAG TPA: adenosylcobinamide-GDP ribazoletransferase [Solirubrobacteraceae bacterium]
MRGAIAFLTILPVRAGAAPPAAAWFPLIGALIGGAAGGVAYLAEAQLGSTVAAVLAITTLAILTGALHLDGLADCADGLGARGGREARLAVMRDSATGVFGALALLLWALLLVAALAGLDREDALRALVVVAATGRWAALLHTATAPPARRDGLGAGFAASGSALAIASLSAAAAALLVAGPGPGVAALAAAAAVAAAVSAWSRAQLGGRTGDTLGATVALTEAVAAVVLLGALQ